ncbi:MAG: hypothetical protein EBZ59_09270 [Planctomycetia bacterium]|nr:hypothetical protein [Planctomycetia bacterium]
MSSDRPELPVPPGSDRLDTPRPGRTGSPSTWTIEILRDQLAAVADAIHDTAQSLHRIAMVGMYDPHEIARLVKLNTDLLVFLNAAGVPVPHTVGEDVTRPELGPNGRGEEP